MNNKYTLEYLWTKILGAFQHILAQSHFGLKQIWVLPPFLRLIINVRFWV